jgi:hypothetical protein
VSAQSAAKSPTMGSHPLVLDDFVMPSKRHITEAGMMRRPSEWSNQMDHDEKAFNETTYGTEEYFLKSKKGAESVFSEKG